jgi:PAS domain S-box-containing protein
MNKKANILVVDDNSENLILLCGILKEEGHNTFPADSGELALASLENNYPDLILLDIKMVGIDGFEVCRRIKLKENLAGIPIIFLSVADEIYDKLEGFKLGAADYITKPFQKEELLIRVKTQLDIYFLNKSLKEKNEEIAALNEKNITTIEYLKDAKEKLEDSETKFHSIFENNSVAICIIEPDTTISMVNSEYCKISGYTREEVIGMSWTQQIPPEDLGRLKEYNRRRLLDPNDAPDKYEFTFYKKNGEIRYALMSVTMLSNKKIIASFADITERKQAEESLKESERLLQHLNFDKDRFISILSHDLKSPFTALLGLSELLKGNIEEFHIDDIRNMAGNIYKTAQSTFNLLEDILMWARTQQGKIPFNPQNLDFTDTCKDAVEVLKPGADAKNITINYPVAKGVTVFADIDMLKTILRNLVSNAIKFSNINGLINVDAKENSEVVTISVFDNGIGIPPGNLKKMFDFSEIITTKGTDGESGTGLGLLLCKEFVEKHGGRIWVESEVGKGSNFKFTLPKSLENTHNINN